jgi:hypothetical protein
MCKKIMSAPTNVVKVKVNRITSMQDPESGRPGKNIELVQVRQRQQQPMYPTAFGGPGDSRMIQDIMSQFQSLGFLPLAGGNAPKLNLFLSESEYDVLGVRFEVNEVYDLILKDGSIKFSKSLEGV